MRFGRVGVRARATSAEKNVRSAAFVVFALSLLGALHALAEEARPTAPERSVLPPPDVDSFRVRAPSPQWDVGVVLGSGAIERQDSGFGGEFLGALELDVSGLRERFREVGLGGRLRVGTLGFKDFRASLAPLLTLPLSDPVALDLSFGPLLATSGQGPLVGFEGSLGVGLRSVNLKGHYAHVHTLVFGYSQTFALGDMPPSEETIAIWAGLRVDGMWFVLPFGVIF